jgi:hypothetical protein
MNELSGSSESTGATGETVSERVPASNPERSSATTRDSYHSDRIAAIEAFIAEEDRALEAEAHFLEEQRAAKDAAVIAFIEDEERMLAESRMPREPDIRHPRRR